MSFKTSDQPLAVVKATDILHPFSLLRPLPIPNQTVRVQRAEVCNVSLGREASEKELHHP